MEWCETKQKRHLFFMLLISLSLMAIFLSISFTAFSSVVWVTFRLRQSTDCGPSWAKISFCLSTWSCLLSTSRSFLVTTILSSSCLMSVCFWFTSWSYFFLFSYRFKFCCTLTIECRGAQAWTKIVLDLNYILMLIYVYIHYHFCQSTFFNFFTLLEIQQKYQQLTALSLLRTGTFHYNQTLNEELQLLSQFISHLWKNLLVCQYFK
ncbi:Hypothetical_protein [Hexamita inflata]|uniref:Hypothetical_protein n=1 Tax=Hexamita inflata TaxID=28002 RepID=A0AA86Q089_9EUKA|nr:Hypothetical protein HINF_LOCUS31777 [Hexamita inflata]